MSYKEPLCGLLRIDPSAALGVTKEVLTKLGATLSCASCVTVVNIDNGFSAAVTATLINKKIEANMQNAESQ